MRNVHKLVNKNPVLVVSTKGIELFRDHLNDVCGLDPHCELPDSSQTMDAGYGASRLASPAPHKVDVSRLHMVESEKINDLVHTILDVRRRIVLNQALTDFSLGLDVFNISGAHA